MTAVADTSPLNYLVQLGLEHTLSSFFKRVVVPKAVVRELENPNAPLLVRRFITDPPAWMELHEVVDAELLEIPAHLHRGEREVIATALGIEAAVAILDDLAARRLASDLGLRIAGTVGILVKGAKVCDFELEAKLTELESMGFYLSEKLRRIAIESGRR